MKANHTRKVLIVEDETIIAMDIAMQLQEMGFEALATATTGEQAIELAVRLRPHLVLMDVHLGGLMDGITAAQAIRTQADIPCIFLSAFNGEDMRARANLTNPAGYLAKPFTDNQLRTVITAAVKEL